jgi:hypothetical protein
MWIVLPFLVKEKCCRVGLYMLNIYGIVSRSTEHLESPYRTENGRNGNIFIFLRLLEHIFRVTTFNGKYLSLCVCM